MRDPDCERAWFGCMLDMLWRFMAEAGIGIAELLLTGAKVCACCQRVFRAGATRGVVA
jgi:hypothetical protein